MHQRKHHVIAHTGVHSYLGDEQVPNLSQFLRDLPSSHTESPLSQKPPQSWVNQNG